MNQNKPDKFDWLVTIYLVFMLMFGVWYIAKLEKENKQLREQVKACQEQK